MMAGVLLVRSRRMLLAQPPLAFVIACCRNFLNSAVKDRLFAAGRRKKLNKINNLRLREKSADELPVFFTTFIQWGAPKSLYQACSRSRTLRTSRLGAGRYG